VKSTIEGAANRRKPVEVPVPTAQPGPMPEIIPSNLYLYQNQMFLVNLYHLPGGKSMPEVTPTTPLPVAEPSLPPEAVARQKAIDELTSVLRKSILVRLD